MDLKDLEIFSYIISLDRPKFATPDKMFIKNTGIKEGEFYLEALSYLIDITYFKENNKNLIISDWKKSMYHPVNIFIINNRKPLFKEEYKDYKNLSKEEKELIEKIFNRYKNLSQEELLKILENEIAYKETDILSTIKFNNFQKQIKKY